MCFYFIGFLIPFTGASMVLPEVGNSSPMLACLITVAESLAKTKAALLYSSEYEHLTTDIIKSVKVQVILNGVELPEFEKLKALSINDFVMIFGPHNVSRVLSETFWNADTNFFVLYQKEEDLEKELASFWEYRVINVYVALEKDQKILFFSYLPYIEDCGMGKPVLAEECSNGQFVKRGATFPRARQLSDLHGCPIKISGANAGPYFIFDKKCGVDEVLTAPGFEGSLMHELSKKMNFTTVFYCNPQGIGWLRPVPGGISGDVYAGKSDFAVGAMAPIMERFFYLDVSVTLNMDECLTFGVPKGFGAQNTTIFDFYTFEFDRHNWILIIIMFLTICFFFTFSNMILEEKWLNRKDDVFMELFASFLGLPVVTPKSSSQKVSVLCWLFFSLIMTVAYKSAMGSKLTVPSKDPDINTFEELIASKLQFIGSKTLYIYLKHNQEDEPVVIELYKKFVVSDMETARVVELIATERKLAYFRHKYIFLYNALLNSAVWGQIHMIDSCILRYHPVLVTKRNSFFTKKLNDVIVRLEESGIMTHWKAEFIFKTPPLPQEFLKITVDRYFGLFCVLIFGYIVSALCFGLEIWLRFHQRRTKKKRRKN